MTTITEPPRMLLVYFTGTSFGDGFRTCLELGEVTKGKAKSRVRVYVPTELATCTIEPRSIAKASEYPYSRDAMRKRILKKARDWKRFGFRFNRRATVEVLQALGAKGADPVLKAPRRQRPSRAQLHARAEERARSLAIHRPRPDETRVVRKPRGDVRQLALAI